MNAMPGLSCLRSFVFAVECGSYSKAADLLGVTHTAIIQHVKVLERLVATPLIVKAGRAIAASEKGTEIYLRIRDAVRSLERAFISDSEPASGRIVISTIPSIVNGWLIPQLPTLDRRFPGVEFSIESNLAVDDFARSGVDLAIRVGDGEWPGVDVRPLLTDEVCPVASPCSPRSKLISTPGDLLKMPLIENPLASWLSWFEANGIVPQKFKPVLTVCDSFSAQLAAEQGIGIALGRNALVRNSLLANRLVLPLPRATSLTTTWWLVKKRGKYANSKMINAVSGALHELARASR